MTGPRAMSPGLTSALADWTECDGAALALGRVLGVFDDTTTLADVRAVLWTNSRAGNTLYGMLEKLVWLGVLESDEAPQRFRVARAGLHALSEVAHVPALQAGPPARAFLRLESGDEPGLRLSADRAGFRHLARVFEEIAESGLEPGWHTTRDASFAEAGPPLLALALVDPSADDPGEGR